MPVYFMQPVDGGPIKIGCSRNIQARRRQLQAQVCQRLVVLATMPGDFVVEGQVQSRFVHLRIEGEWYEPAEELMALVERAKAGKRWVEARDNSPGEILAYNLKRFGLPDMDSIRRLINQTPGWDLDVFLRHHGKCREPRDIDWNNPWGWFIIKKIASMLGVKSSQLRNRPVARPQKLRKAKPGESTKEP